MSLIDANKLYKHKFKSVSERMDLDVEYMFGWNDAIDSIVENAPTVDAVEVVRCKDCKWSESKYLWNGDPYTECSYLEIPMDDNNYCSWGERKDDEIN